MAIASARAISPVIGSEISFRAFAFQMIMRRASAMANRASIARRERPEYKTIETKEARDASPRGFFSSRADLNPARRLCSLRSAWPAPAAHHLTVR